MEKKEFKRLMSSSSPNEPSYNEFLRKKRTGEFLKRTWFRIFHGITKAIGAYFFPNPRR